MKRIVLYTIVFTTGLLACTPEISGQKPTIDLLPSANQHLHPEAIVDTTFSSDSLVKAKPGEQPSSLYINPKEIEHNFEKE